MFKITECARQDLHDPKKCKSFHDKAKDKRRCFSTHAYSTEICPHTGCQNEECSHAHNKVEFLYHYENYKTKFCSRPEKCSYNNYCSFAHSEEDIKTPLLHKMNRNYDFYMFYFKTEWCVYDKEHNKADCVYAHNWQDFRRRPHLFSYNPTQKCDSWKQGEFISHYY
jgi:hypothetical protein